MDPVTITAILSVVQILGTQIGTLLSAAKDGGATDEQIQTAYDDAHARAMTYTPLTREQVEEGTKPPA